MKQFSTLYKSIKSDSMSLTESKVTHDTLELARIQVRDFSIAEKAIRSLDRHLYPNIEGSLERFKTLKELTGKYKNDITLVPKKDLKISRYRGIPVYKGVAYRETGNYGIDTTQAISKQYLTDLYNNIKPDSFVSLLTTTNSKVTAKDIEIVVELLQDTIKTLNTYTPKACSNAMKNVSIAINELPNKICSNLERIKKGLPTLTSDDVDWISSTIIRIKHSRA